MPRRRHRSRSRRRGWLTGTAQWLRPANQSHGSPRGNEAAHRRGRRRRVYRRSRADRRATRCAGARHTRTRARVTRASLRRCEDPRDVASRAPKPFVECHASATIVVGMRILIGLPASGKSTFFRERFAGTHDHVSKDLLRPTARANGGRAAHLGIARIRTVGRRRQYQPERRMRAPIIAAARKQRRVVGYFSLMPPTRCGVIVRARTRARAGRRYLHGRKRLEPPTLAEGFDRVFSVSLDRRNGPSMWRRSENLIHGRVRWNSAGGCCAIDMSVLAVVLSVLIAARNQARGSEGSRCSSTSRGSRCRRGGVAAAGGRSDGKPSTVPPARGCQDHCR